MYNKNKQPYIVNIYLCKSVVQPCVRSKHLYKIAVLL